MAHQWYATLLSALGRHDEALHQIELAEAFDPLSHAISVTSAIIRVTARDYKAAIAQLERTLELDPDYFSAYVYLMLCYTELGRYEDARWAYEEILRLRPEVPQWSFFLANAHARAGREDAARELLAGLTGESDSPTLRAWVHATLGDIDASFELLERELTDGSWSMFVFFRALLFFMDEGPFFDPLTSDPRFDELIERANLP